MSDIFILYVAFSYTLVLVNTVYIFILNPEFMVDKMRWLASILVFAISPISSILICNDIYKKVKAARIIAKKPTN